MTDAGREMYRRGWVDALKYITKRARARMYKQSDLAEYGVVVAMLRDELERGEWPPEGEGECQTSP